MGNCWSRRNASSETYGGNLRNITVAVLGLDDAGKTVTAKVLKGDPPNEVVPTIGFTNIQFNFKKRRISMYDLGGGPRIRDIWRNYLGEVHGFIYVVDSSHRERIEECREVLVGILNDIKVKGKPLLVLGNKQDIHGAMDTSEICDFLKLDALANNHQSPCRIECCSALRQENGKRDGAIISGFQWLLDMIDMHWVTLKARVDKDVADQKEHDLKARLERAERVRKLREEREKESEKNGEKDQSKAEDEEIHGNPFKPIDGIQFSRNVVKTQESVSTANIAANHSSPADLLETEKNSVVLTSSGLREEERVSDEVENHQPTCQLEMGHAGNGVHGRTSEPSSLSPAESIDVERRKPTPVTSNVLPPIELPAEHGDRKKRKRRNKRNRVGPLVTGLANEVDPIAPITSRQQCLDSKSSPADRLDQAVTSTDDDSATRSKVASCLSSLESRTPRDGASDLATEDQSALQTTVFARPNGDSEEVVL